MSAPMRQIPMITSTPTDGLPPIRLYVIRCGELVVYPHSPQEYCIPVQWYVLTHPNGNVVIDGGNAPAVAADPRARWGAIVDVVWPTMTAQDSCVVQLEELGIAPESVKWIVQTHLHHDHTGAMSAIERFPNANVMARRAEYDYARSPDWFYRPSYVVADFESEQIPWVFLGEAEDGFDLYGDGVIKAWRTPGHTPGHQSFEIKLPESGTVIITGDAVSNAGEWEQGGLPPMTVSNTEAAASVAKLHNIARRSGAQVIFSHDGEQWPQHPNLPGFYV